MGHRREARKMREAERLAFLDTPADMPQAEPAQPPGRDRWSPAAAEPAPAPPPALRPLPRDPPPTCAAPGCTGFTHPGDYGRRVVCPAWGAAS